MAESENWSMIITPKRKLLEIPFRELIRYRDLIFLFVRRDFIVSYQQTILGPLWFVINPFFSTIIYTFVFGRLAKIGTDGIPYTLFYYSGTMLWTFFINCFNDASNIFTSNAHIFGKVYFPRLAIPINNVLTNGIKLLVQCVMLSAVLIYHLCIGAPAAPSWFSLLIPFLLVWLAAAGVGAGMIISSLTTKYRDLRSVVGFAAGLVMYASPVVYPLTEIPPQFKWLAYINPICAPIELFRLWFFGTASATGGMILSSLGITAALVFLGLILFNQNEQNFIDVV
jgi:lipopolysaccharide transport system permease protein